MATRSDPLSPGAAERFAHATIAMARLSSTGVLLLVSHALGELLGRPAADLQGRAAWRVGLGTQTDVAALMRAVAAGQPGGVLRLSVRTARGSTTTERVAWSLAGTAGSEVNLVLVDDPEPAPTPAQVTKAEARWHSLLQSAAHLSWTADAEGTLRWISTSPSVQLGGEGEEVCGRPLRDFVHPFDLPGFDALWERLLTTDEHRVGFKGRVRGPDGAWLWMSGVLTDLRADGHVQAIAGHLNVLAAERHQAGLASSRLAQLTLDAEWRIVRTNPALCLLLGYPEQALLGRAWAELQRPPVTSVIDQLLAPSAEQDGPLECTLIGSAGQEIPVALDASWLRDVAGAPLGVEVCVHDRSALRAAEARRQLQEEFFAVLSTRASDLALVADADGQIVYASPAVEHMMGYQASEVVAHQGWDFVHPDDEQQARAVYEQVVVRGGTATFELRVRDKEGTWRWVEETATNLLDTAVAGVVCNLRDVTDRHDAEAALQASESRYRAIADTADEGIWAVDPEGGTLYANARMADLMGIELSELYGRSKAELLDPDGVLGLADRFRRRVPGSTERYQLPYEHPDGGRRQLRVAATPLVSAEGEAEGSLAMISDATETARQATELRHAALHDGLTGLPNRALLLDRIAQAAARGEAEGRQAAVLFLDLDDFRMINDARGHVTGDLVLLSVADRLRAALTPADTLARFGSDEFVVVRQCTGVDEVQATARELLAALERPFSLPSGDVLVRASVGIATSPPGDAELLLRQASSALNAAKSEQRGGVRLFDEALIHRAEEQDAIARDLRTALVTDEGLELHYQPIVELDGCAVRGVEALMRWTHPAHGPLAPDRFVAVAQATGLGHELDRWVITRALSEAAAMRRCGALAQTAYVAVNVSPRSLTDTWLEQLLIGETERHGTAPALVVLEITEGAMMRDLPQSVAVLTRLREHGFGVAVDDFGTGYSSLAYLRDLPISCVKIDRAFVSMIAADDDALAITASVIDLARAINVTTVAEGVETAEQAAVLKRLGARFGQGWLWHQAIPASEVIAQGGYPHLVQPGTGSGHASAPAACPVAPLEQPSGQDRILELHQSGASLTTIAAALNREGLRTSSGMRWHRNTVAQHITAARYPSLRSGVQRP